MSKISLYKIFLEVSRFIFNKPNVLELTEAERLALEKGFRLGEKHCFRMRAFPCSIAESRWTVFSSGWSADENEQRECKRVGKTFQIRRYQWIENSFWQRSETYHGLLGRGSCAPCNRARQAECKQGKSSMVTSLRFM